MFYRINYSLHNKEIGEFPQVSEGIYHTKIQDPRFIGNSDFSFIEFIPEVPGLILADCAKLTDLLSASIMGTNGRLVVSKKLKTLLEKEGVEGVQFFETYIIEQNKKTEGYYIMHPFCFRMDVIDFSSSDLWITGSGNQKIKQVWLQSIEEYENLSKELVLPESLFIQRPAIKMDELVQSFVLRGVNGGVGYYASSHLKKQIESSGCTGISFEPL